MSRISKDIAGWFPPPKARTKGYSADFDSRMPLGETTQLGMGSAPASGAANGAPAVGPATGEFTVTDVRRAPVVRREGAPNYSRGGCAPHLFQLRRYGLGVGWLPLLILPAVSLALRNMVAPWVLMWMLALALYAGCKWLTWWRCSNIQAPRWRHWAYLIAWPGMDAKAFLDTKKYISKPQLHDWIAAFLKTAFGTLLV